MHAEGVRQGHPLRGLARAIPARAAVCATLAQQHRPPRLPQVHVLRGVEVGRIRPHQATAGRQVTRHFLGDRRGVVAGDNLLHCHPVRATGGPCTESDVEPQAVRGMGSAGARRLGRCRPAHHQAGAGHHPTGMRCHDAPVNPGALANIIRLDEQILLCYQRSEPQIRTDVGQHGCRSAGRLGAVTGRTAVPIVVGMQSRESRTSPPWCDTPTDPRLWAGQSRTRCPG
jgi:hypothetical protein